MKRSWGTLGTCFLVGALAGNSDALANCQSEGPYPVTQCATRAGPPSWFARKPLDAGTVSATWWILGMGNRPVVDHTIGVSVNPVDGDGFIDVPSPGVFIGVDSGALTSGPATGSPTGGLDLIDAVVGTGTPLAAGGLCFSASANWALPFVDGCSDQNRTYSTLGAGSDASDDYLDPYFFGSPGALNDYSLVDAPMGVLLTESNNKYFAVAFFSSSDRGQNPNDIFDKGYDMGAIVNGDNNPSHPSGNDNIVPWQPIPQPNVSLSPFDPIGSRTVSMAWASVRLVHDGSSRLNTAAMVDPAASRFVLGTDRNGVDLTGVGVMEQPELVSYIVERKPVGNGCHTNEQWVAAGPPIVPAIATPGGTPLSTSVTVPVPADNHCGACVRLTTRLGRIPSEAFASSPATVSTRNMNRFAAQAGNLGDIGYEVSSPGRVLCFSLASDKPVVKSAVLDRRNLVVEFQTLGEMALESFEVVATDGRGKSSVVATVECDQCSSGIGSDYRIEVPAESVRSVRSVHIVAQPSGTVSNEIAVARSSPRPETPGRGRANR